MRNLLLVTGPTDFGTDPLAQEPPPSLATSMTEFHGRASGRCGLRVCVVTWLNDVDELLLATPTTERPTVEPGPLYAAQPAPPCPGCPAKSAGHPSPGRATATGAPPD